jgi:hypothetical protein
MPPVIVPSKMPLDPPPRRRGAPQRYDWGIICGEIARRCIDPRTGRVRVPDNESALVKAVLDHLAENGHDCPSVSMMREAVKHMCAALRRVQK